MFREIEKKIIVSLKKSGYSFFDGNMEEAFDTLVRALEAMPNYVNTVITEERLLPIYRVRYDGENLRDKTMELDARRRLAHDNCIGQLNCLNRLFKFHGLPPFANVDTSDRYAVADFAGMYVCEVYNEGRGKTMDDAVAFQKEYSLKYLKEDIKAMFEE